MRQRVKGTGRRRQNCTHLVLIGTVFLCSPCSFHFARGWRRKACQGCNRVPHGQCAGCHPWDRVPSFYENTCTTAKPQCLGLAEPCTNPLSWSTRVWGWLRNQGLIRQHGAWRNARIAPQYTHPGSYALGQICCIALAGQKVNELQTKCRQSQFFFFFQFMLYPESWLFLHEQWSSQAQKTYKVQSWREMVGLSVGICWRLTSLPMTLLQGEKGRNWVQFSGQKRKKGTERQELVCPSFEGRIHPKQEARLWGYRLSPYDASKSFSMYLGARLQRYLAFL